MISHNCVHKSDYVFKGSPVSWVPNRFSSQNDEPGHIKKLLLVWRRLHEQLGATRWARRFVVKTVFPWVASRTNMLYLAWRVQDRAAVCLHAAHIVCLRELCYYQLPPMEAPFSHDHWH